jgi:hypothetical protein
MGWGTIAQRIRNLDTRWRWSALYPGHFTTGERTPVTRWIGGLVGPTAGLDAVARNRIPSPCRESNPVRPTNDR